MFILTFRRVFFIFFNSPPWHAHAHILRFICTLHTSYTQCIHFVSICNQILRMCRSCCCHSIKDEAEKEENVRYGIWLEYKNDFMYSLHIKSIRVLIIEKCHPHKMKIQYSFAPAHKYFNQTTEATVTAMAAFSAVRCLLKCDDSFVPPFPF